MSEFENIVIGSSAIPSLVITTILMFLIPVVFLIYWRRNHKQQTNFSWMIAGAVGFIVSARILELGVHMLCIVMDNPVSRFINSNTAAYVIYGITMAGVFEECGRYIVMKFIMKKNRTRENSFMYGIGHGGIEIMTVLLPAIITYLAVAVLFSSENVENALNTLNITQENASAALPSVQAAASFGYAMMAMNVIERLLAMVSHIGLSVIVFYGVVNDKKIYLPVAIILHMLMDAFAALYQRGVVPLWTAQLWGAIWTVVVALIAIKLYKRNDASGNPSIC